MIIMIFNKRKTLKIYWEVVHLDTLLKQQENMMIYR
jgi:hypothetical protein